MVGPVDTVLAEGRSTFVAVVVERHIVVDHSLGRLGGRSCENGVSIFHQVRCFGYWEKNQMCMTLRHRCELSIWGRKQRTFVVGTEDRLGSSLGSTCLLNRFSRMCGLRVAFGLMLCVRDPFVRR